MLIRFLFICLIFCSLSFGREALVRYWVNGDSVELEAIFIKIQSDTVYLKAPEENDLKRLEKIADKETAALQESNGQKVEADDEDEEENVPQKDSAQVIMTDAVKDSIAAISDTTKQDTVVEEIVDEDPEAALEREKARKKQEEIARIEKEIRDQEIQDSIAAAKANPFIKIYRLDLKRLYNLEDNAMIDLSLSDYVIPDPIVEEEVIELYPPGNANLLVLSEPEACSLYVNGVSINQLAPDTIKNIKPGKYTISVMRMLRDTEWWGTAVVKINADSLNVVKIPVAKPSTRLTLTTIPEAVEVFINKKPTEYIMPEHITDVIVEDIKPQVQATVYLRRVGYRDTSVTLEIRPFMPNQVTLEMTAVTDDLEFIHEQKEYNRRRQLHKVGRGMLWGSIAPLLAGGVLWYMAEQNWSDAADKKHAYEKHSAFDSKDTQKMIKDNHELNKKGDKQGIAAICVGGVGLGLLTAGIILAF
ncbi:MAG: hypothetical protein HUK20_08945 [Fibrobacter sp.]|nr:hypothetical protein [Fibrobacter sp.]